MQNEYMPYAAGDVLPQKLAAFRNRPCALPYSNQGYVAPSPEEISQLIKLAGWSQNDCARLTGVSYNPKKGSPTVRRWKAPVGTSGHRDIPYAAWRLLLLYAGVVGVDEALKELGQFKNLR